MGLGTVNSRLTQYNAASDALLNEEVTDFEEFQKDYDNYDLAKVDKFIPVPGVWSIFNPFNIFRYSKYGLNAVQYIKDLHYDAPIGDPDQAAAVVGLNFTRIGDVLNGEGNVSDIFQPINTNDEFSSTVESTFKDKIGEFTDVRRTVIENPTAANIIDWSRLVAGQNQGEMASAMSPTPYTARDFLWCKYYGKVPNNRLVTLRRYHMPVEDNLKISAEKGPLVPLAQAVTWYGSDVGNGIDKIIPMGWGLKWAPKTAKVQDIQGNEISVDDLLSTLGIQDEKKKGGKLLSDVLKSQIFSGGGKVDILKLAGYDKSIQDYIKGAYTDDGPYWNRVLGPVNVVDSTFIRDRGFDTTGMADITLNFEYSLRSFGATGRRGINPKMAFLDLLSNFLSLTYNTAPFWGGGARYFQKTGVTIPGLAMEQEMLDGDVLGAIQVGIEQLSSVAGKNLQQLVDLAKKSASFVGTGGLSDADLQKQRKKLDFNFEQGQNLSPEELSRIKAEAQDKGIDPSVPFAKLIAPRIGQLLQKPLIYRSILDGRATGEWHLTIGNPMNPWAVMGNLYLKTVKVTFDEKLSIDDFPTEVKFVVTLGHGRPRAKQDIESIFNMGNGAMSFTKLSPPSSAYNSYGEATSNRLNSALPGSQISEGGGGDPIPLTGNSAVSDAERAQNQELDVQALEEGRARVRERYGEAFGNAPILQDYFLKVYTKD
jgi:hypothetical protein